MSETEKWRLLELAPLRNNVYAMLDEVPEKAGMIYLSEQQATPTRIGTVIAVGPKVAEVKVGDRFVSGVHSGTNLYLWQYGISDERWKIFTESEIMATVLKELPSEEG
jgi:co-chaperonin GroES (HSP10)